MEGGFLVLQKGFAKSYGILGSEACAVVKPAVLFVSVGFWRRKMEGCSELIGHGGRGVFDAEAVDAVERTSPDHLSVGGCEEET